MAQSKLLKNLENGTMLDYINAYYRHGEKVFIDDETMKHLEMLEYIRDLWLVDKDEVTVRNKIVTMYNISNSQAHNYIQDAKLIWALSQRFNYTFELAIQKERIERAFAMGFSNKDAKLLKSAFEANEKWMEMSRKDAERNKPQAEKNISIVFHMDFTQFMSPEQMETAKARIIEIKEKARKKFKDFEEAEIINESR